MGGSHGLAEDAVSFSETVFLFLCGLGFRNPWVSFDLLGNVENATMLQYFGQ
jgi:hypothetical protein